MKISVSEELKKNAKWRLGDVIADRELDQFAMIVKDNNGDYIAMDIGEIYSDVYTTQAESIWYGPCDSIDDLEKKPACRFAIKATKPHILIKLQKSHHQLIDK